VQHFLQKHAGAAKPRITQAAMSRLTTYLWPGNVRQLENEIRRALVLSDGIIDREHLSPDIAGAGRLSYDGTSSGHKPVRAGAREAGLITMRDRINAMEEALVRDALEKTKGNQTQAAKMLGVSRFGLQKMIRRLAIDESK
jgi:DNA-binding NtrC family response regulator